MTRRQAGSPDARSFLEDIRHVLPKLKIATAFDVGANVGQSLRRFEPAFPEAVFHAFEPAPEAFAALSGRYGAAARVRLHRLALGAAGGRALITDHARATGNQIVSDAQGRPTHEIEMTTGDAFCADAGIAGIDFLKIDTEGHDLDVLRGFERMLGAGAVALVQVEAALNPDNRRHVPLPAFAAFLEPLGYRLFGIYELVREFSGLPHLRRCNPVFVAAQTARTNQAPRTGRAARVRKAASAARTGEART